MVEHASERERTTLDWHPMRGRIQAETRDCNDEKNVLHQRVEGAPVNATSQHAGRLSDVEDD